MPAFLRIYSDRTLLVLLLAGFSAGLPLLLVTKCLQAWFAVSGVDDVTISYAALIGLPWSLKFLWAPLLDKVVPPSGRRRGWLMATVVLLMLGMAGMSTQSPLTNLNLLVANAVLLALFSATQDVVIDAFRVEALTPERQGAGAASYVMGYRAATLLTGGLGMILADRLSWPAVYLLMAMIQGVGLCAWLLMREPPSTPPATWRSAVIDPLGEYIGRRGLKSALIVAAFAILYKLGDTMAGTLSTPFLLKAAGFSQTQIGLIQNTYGLAALTAGVVIGGLALPILGLNRSLWIFGIGQALSNLAYVGLAHWGGGVPALVAVMTVENLCGGLGTACFMAFLAGECSVAFAATQYAILSSLMAAGRDVLSSSAGVDKVHYGLSWSGFFLFTVLAAVPGLLLLPAVAPWRLNAKPPTE